MSERHTVTLQMRTVEDRFRRVYERRGMEIPTANSGHPRAALWPYSPRFRHKVYAMSHGYFWLPCVLCTEYFGGYEIVDIIPDPIKGEGRGMMICPACTASRNGGRP